MGIYHACDIRGVAGTELTDELVMRIGRAIGVSLAGQRVVVGGDVRLSTPRYQPIMVQALRDSGCQVCDIGIVATPLFYYALRQLAAAGGVMITASHNPAKYNGFKMVLGPRPVSETDVQLIAERVAQEVQICGVGTVQEINIVEEYLAFTAAAAAKPERRLKVVVDAGNGATAAFAPALFRQAGYEVVELHCVANGHFPNRPPNPALAENLAELGARVRETGADLGVAFDGDGDRAGFVDENGRAVDNDDILVLLARSYLRQGPGTVIYDAKCSMVVPEAIREAGGRAVMARAGHTFSKAAFLDEQALFAGEISGHFFCSELGYDDAMFAALKVCAFVAAEGSLATLVDAIPNYLLTPDIRVPYTGQDKDAILDAVAARLADYPLNRIDGVRIEFPDGWGMIRASVTEPLFTLRFEAKERERLEEIYELLIGALPRFLQGDVAAKLPDPATL